MRSIINRNVFFINIMKKHTLNYVFITLIIFIISCESRTTSNVVNGTSLDFEDELVEVEEQYEDDCDDCYGTGRIISNCTSCEGSGETYHYIVGTRPKQCYNCIGTGVVKCEICDGGMYSVSIL